MVRTILFAGVFSTLFLPFSRGAGPVPIRSVEVRPNGALRVNGRPFVPLMGWLQDAKNFPLLKKCGMNATAGFWSPKGDTAGVVDYLAEVRRAGLYGVMPFDERLKGNPALLGYIHGDEPDLPHQESDARIVPSERLKINRRTPLWKIVDGVTHSWSVLDPLKDAEFTIRFPKPLTVEKTAVWLTVSPGLSVAREISLVGDGKELLRVELEKKRGAQEFPLKRPARFRSLTVRVLSVYPGKNEWGSIGEIEGFDASGKNVFLSPPRYVPRRRPEAVLEEYRRINAADPTRPVFMTLTAYFFPFFKKWSDHERRELYPRYIEAADVVGFDVYPIYGWNKPEWIHLVHDATAELKRLAGRKPLYAWIETSKGGRWTGPLERQKDVTPREIRAEVWMALCAGATGIGYFTHIWKPSYKQFGVPERNRKAILEINREITRLAPVLLSEAGRDVRIEASSEVKLTAIARRYGGATYVFAVNYDERRLGAEAVVKLEGLSEGTEIDVLGEGRSLRSLAGLFSDTFEPLAVHIYKIGR